MVPRLTLFAAVALLAACLPAGAQTHSHKKPAAAPKVKYEAVQHFFVVNCLRCHQPPGPKGGIDLQTYENVMKGGDDGKIVKPGDPANSVLWKSVAHKPGVRVMPPKVTLKDADVKLIETWIKQGAKK